MSKTKFVEYVEELLESFGSVKVRAMFGGYGIYKDQLIFALIIDNELYFKADKEASEYYKSFGSEPFTYSGKGKIVTMPYWKILPEVMEDTDQLAQWLKFALNAANNSKKKGKK